MKAVVEQDAEPPSSAIDRTVRVTSDGAIRQAWLTPFSVSRPREGTPERLRHRLRGDLDAILMTALRKEPERRYASVAALAADLRSHLTGRPVSARPDRVLYRARKFASRNRWGVLAALTILGLVVGAATNAFVQSRRVTRERDRAARVSRFLVDLFSVSDPGTARGNTVTAREVLDKGAQKIDHDLKEQPEVRADLMETMADVYNRLGLYDRAEPLARASLLFRRQVQDPRALGQSQNLLGNILMDRGDLPGAEAAYRESLELRRRVHGSDSIEVAQSLNNLSSVVDPQGRYDESDRLLQESLAIKRKRLAADDPSLATSIANLGVNFYRRGDLVRAEALLREGLAIQRKALGEDHPEVAFSTQSVGVILDEQGKYEEAEKTYREALAIQHKVLGAEHPDIVTTLTNLANTLSHGGRLAAADAAYREALTMSEKVYGRQTTDTAHVLAGLGELERRQGRLAQAYGLARESLATREKLLGATHQDTAEAVGLLGRVLLDLGRYPEAEATLLRAQGLLDKPDVPQARRADVQEAIRRLREKQGRPQAATPRE
jgi:serine/threonine-protein kinase